MRPVSVLLVLVLLAAPALAVEEPAKTFDELLKEGERLVEAGKFTEAQKVLIRASRRNPRSAAPLVALARLEFRRAMAKGDRMAVNRALLLLREAGSRERNHGGISFVSGEIALALREHARAVSAFRTAIQRKYRVRDAEALLARSLVYLAADQAKGGRVPHDDVIAVLVEARSRLDALRKDESRADGERQVFERLWKMTLNNMAAVHQRARDLPKAQAILEELVKADPTNAGYRFGLGLVLGDQRLYDEAMVQYKKALELSKDPDWVEPYRPMGHIASQKEQVEEAESYFARFLEKRPDDWDGWNNYGDHLLRHKKAEKAAEAFLRCVEIDRKRFAAVRKLATALLRAGHQKRSAKWRTLHAILEREREEWERGR